VPQFILSPAHVTGVHPPRHTLLVQVCPNGQVPQSSVPPQPSEAVPELKLLLMHVACGTQQTLLMRGSAFGRFPQLSFAANAPRRISYRLCLMNASAFSVTTLSRRGGPGRRLAKS
jgi:hypothetical protein